MGLMCGCKLNKYNRVIHSCDYHRKLLKNYDEAHGEQVKCTLCDKKIDTKKRYIQTERTIWNGNHGTSVEHWFHMKCYRELF